MKQPSSRQSIFSGTAGGAPLPEKVDCCEDVVPKGEKLGTLRADLYGMIFTYDHRVRSAFDATKGRFTRQDFFACDKLTTGLGHELFRVNQTDNLLTAVVYVPKNVIGF